VSDISTIPNQLTLANPGRRSASALEMLPRLEMMEACYGGTETMRQMRHLFLPQYPRETDDRYENRLRSTFALNKLREAVDTASAKPFKNLLSLTDAPDEVSEWMWDVDLEGHHLHLVAHNHFNRAVLKGLSHIFVDHPTTANLSSLAEQRSLNIRPFMRLIRPEDLLAVYHERIGGERRVVHARIASTRVGFDRETFREVTYDQVYVIEPGVVQLWERPRWSLYGYGYSWLGKGASINSPRPLPVQYHPEQGGYGWTLVRENRMALDRVPLVTMVAGDKMSDQNVRPIFQDLAYKQIEHFISSSDQRNILSAGRFAMLACSGVQLEENGPAGQGFEVGPWKVLTSPDPQGRWYYVEPEGAAISAGQKDIETLEVQMDQLSLNPIISAPGRQYVAQNERSITENRVNTVIHDMAMTCRDSLEEAICYMGMWTNQDLCKVRIDMNFDFSTTDERAKNISSVLQAVTAGVLSREGALLELQRLNLIEENFDIKAEMARQTLAQENVDQQHGNDLELQDEANKAQIAAAEQQSRDFPKGKDRPK
jgi:hypothetical protein